MEDLQCSFCGRQRRQVGRLISGPQAFICDHCVGSCRQSMDAQLPPPSAPKRPPAPPQGKWVSSEQLSELLAAHDWDYEAILPIAYGLPVAKLDQLTIPADVIALVPCPVAWRYCLVPIARTATTITLAMEDPNNGKAIATVLEATGLDVSAMVAAPEPVHRAVRRYYPRGTIRPHDKRHCSFCGKRALEVSMLFAPPTAEVNLCDECLLLCEDIVAVAATADCPTPRT